MINSEEWLKQAQEIMDRSCFYESIEDEVIKLVCLFTRCRSSLEVEGENMLSRKYVLEKAARILQGIPIILDEESKRMYASIKMDRKERNEKP